MTSLDFLLIGIIGGLTPGPLTALMLGETLKNGVKAGLQVPAALFLSNAVFALFTVSLLTWGVQVMGLLTLLPYAGAVLLVFLGIQEWRSAARLQLSTAHYPFRKAFLIDFINPHPYLFWLTVLAPAMVIAITVSGLRAALPLWMLFTIGLCGTKVLLVLMAHRIRPWLQPGHLEKILKVLAIALILFGLKLLL